MPSSDVDNIAPIMNEIHRLQPRRVLDVGAGHGKYALLCREYVLSVEEVEAIEVVEEYVRRFDLACLYDHVHVMPLQRFTEWDRFDLILLIDVIEHLPKRQGWELLDAIARAGTPAIVSTPRYFFQNEEAEQYPSERHRSLWKPEDFRGHRQIDSARSLIYTIGG